MHSTTGEREKEISLRTIFLFGEKNKYYCTSTTIRVPNFRLKLNKVQSVRGKVQKLVAAGSGRGARESSRALLAPRFPSQPPGAPGGTGGGRGRGQERTIPRRTAQEGIVVFLGKDAGQELNSQSLPWEEGKNEILNSCLAGRAGGSGSVPSPAGFCWG